MGYQILSYFLALSSILSFSCLNNAGHSVRAEGADINGGYDVSDEPSEISSECAQKCDRCYPSSDLLGRTACGQKCDLEGAGIFTCSVNGKEPAKIL